MSKRSHYLEARRTVTVTLSDNLRYATFNDFYAAMTAAQIRAKEEGLFDLRVDIDYERGYYDSVDITACIYARRYETEEELMLREREQQAQALSADRNEYARYLALKKKFENRELQ